MKYVIMCAVALALGGCVTTNPGPTSALDPVCEALGPPHEYNSHNKNSPYHAGPKVSPRLQRDNNVGQNLHCPGYE